MLHRRGVKIVEKRSDPSTAPVLAPESLPAPPESAGSKVAGLGPSGTPKVLAHFECAKGFAVVPMFADEPGANRPSD